MRQTLIAMSANLNVPQHQLLSEFDRLVPEPDLTPGPAAHLPFADLAEARGLPRLTFEHDCK